MALTTTTGKKRRKRNAGVGDLESEDSCDASTIRGFYGCQLTQFMSVTDGSYWNNLADLLWHGE